MFSLDPSFGHIAYLELGIFGLIVGLLSGALVSIILPRRRNLWVTDTLQRRAPEVRLAQPAKPMCDSVASAFSSS